MKIKRFAGVILEDTDDRLILQERDNKPDIIAPGEISIFGGETKIGETSGETAIREINEELSLSIAIKDLVLLHTWPPEKEGDGLVIRTIFYMAQKVRPEELELHEGKAIIFLPATANLDDPNLKINNFAKKAIKKFWETPKP